MVDRYYDNVEKRRARNAEHVQNVPVIPVDDWIPRNRLLVPEHQLDFLNPYVAEPGRRDLVANVVHSVAQGFTTLLWVPEPAIYDAVYGGFLGALRCHWPVAEHGDGWWMVQLDANRVNVVRILVPERDADSPSRYMMDTSLGFQHTWNILVDGLIVLSNGARVARQQRNEQ